MKFLIEDTHGRRVSEGKEHLPLRDLDRCRPNTRLRAHTGEVDRNGAWSHQKTSDSANCPAWMVLTSYKHLQAKTAPFQCWMKKSGQKWSNTACFLYLKYTKGKPHLQCYRLGSFSLWERTGASNVQLLDESVGDVDVFRFLKLIKLYSDWCTFLYIEYSSTQSSKYVSFHFTIFEKHKEYGGKIKKKNHLWFWNSE